MPAGIITQLAVVVSSPKPADWREMRESPGQEPVRSSRQESSAVVDVGAAVGSGLDQRAAGLGPEHRPLSHLPGRLEVQPCSHRAGIPGGVGGGG